MSPDFQGTAEVVERSPDRVRLRAELSAPGFVVLRDGYDAGWRARIDGRDAAVLRADVAFRAVAVAAGRHEIEYAYHAPGLPLGLALSATGLLAALAALRRPR